MVRLNARRLRSGHEQGAGLAQCRAARAPIAPAGDRIARGLADLGSAGRLARSLPGAASRTASVGV
jgi:hypothetical protein